MVAAPVADIETQRVWRNFKTLPAQQAYFIILRAFQQRENLLRLVDGVQQVVIVVLQVIFGARRLLFETANKLAGGAVGLVPLRRRAGGRAIARRPGDQGETKDAAIRGTLRKRGIF